MNNITSIIIPDSVTEIDDEAFFGCMGLTSVTIPNIEVAEDNTAYASVDSVLFNTCAAQSASKDKTVLIKYPEDKQGAYCIPAGVTSIGEFAVIECAGLTSVTFPDSMVAIGDHAFGGCIGLTAVTIPASVTKIGYLTFDGCTRLASIAVHPDNPAYRSDNGVLFNRDMTELILYPQGRQGDYAVPDSVIEIHTRAFAGCTGLTSVILPDSLQVIGFCAFGGCTGLTSIALPDSVTKIRSFAFSRCTGLTSMVIPRSVKKIEKKAFVDCHNLTAITVHPDNPVYTSENGKLAEK